MGTDMIYLDPASIYLYEIIDNKLIFKSKFQDDTGYRFTAHKAFKRENHPYVVTIGHPNRLFIIDGITMKKVKTIDLGDTNILDSKENCKQYLNTLNMNDHYNEFRYSTIEVSDDGKYLIFWDQTYCYALNTVTLEIDNLFDFSLPGFKQKTYHSSQI